MTSVFGRFGMFCACVSVLASGVVADPTISLKAIKINGGSIAPSGLIEVSPGDTIDTEFYASDWSPSGERLRAFQASIRRSSFSNGTRGTVLPLGWDRPAKSEDDLCCSCDPPDICPAEYPVCDPTGFCVGTTFDPTTGMLLDQNHPDWVFTCGLSPCSAIPAVDYSGALMRFAGTLISPGDAALYVSPPKYCGTLNLQVSDDACGDFVFDILPPTNSTLTDEFSQLILPLVTEGLVVRVTSLGADPGQCSCGSIVESDPPNCTIDARQPTEPDGSNPQTWNSITLTFDCDDTATITDVANFAVTQNPPFGGNPGISGFVPSGNQLTINFDGSFNEQKWTCVQFDPAGGGDKVCFGVSPGDVDGSLLSELVDITAMVSCLNAPGSCTVYQCDSDRSSACASRDILREIDMLTGADTYPVYLGEGIVTTGGDPIPCPTARP